MAFSISYSASTFYFKSGFAKNIRNRCYAYGVFCFHCLASISYIVLSAKQLRKDLKDTSIVHRFNRMLLTWPGEAVGEVASCCEQLQRYVFFS